MALRTLTTEEEMNALIQQKKPVILMAHHSGSLTSRTVVNAIQRIAESDIDAAIIDMNSGSSLFKALGITTVPTVVGFNNGIEQNRTVGIQSESFYRELVNPKKQKQIKLYKTPTCPWCTVAKKHLDSKGVSYIEIDVSTDYAAANYLMQKSGQTGVPQIEIGDEIVVGADIHRIDDLLRKM